MQKVITILFLLTIVFASYASKDSTSTVVKNPVVKSKGDSIMVQSKGVQLDSVKLKTDVSKLLLKPDSLQKFVDENGDGYNDNAPDDDGDGIPNALDKDYWALKEKDNPKPEDGAPPKVLGLDKTPGKVKTNKPEGVKRKPQIKFKRPRGPKGKR